MLAQIVFVEQEIGDRRAVRRERQRHQRHAGDLFKDDGVMHGVVGRLAPGERRVFGNEDAGDFHRVAGADRLDDHLAGVGLVFALDFLAGQRAAAGDGAVEVVGVRRAERGNGATSLCPRRRVR